MLRSYFTLRLLLLSLFLLVSCKPDDGQIATGTPDLGVILTPAPETMATAVPTSPPAPTAKPALSLTEQDITLFPAPVIYAGEQVSVRVQPVLPAGIRAEDVAVELWIDGQFTAEQPLNTHPLSNKAEAVAEWIWDSSEGEGLHQLEVRLFPQNDVPASENNIVMPFTILPATATGTWTVYEVECCRLHVVTGSRAARELYVLTDAVETAVAKASRRLGESPNHVIDFYFIERMIGQGGYAGDAIVISYGEREYANIQLQQILTHESIHIIDKQFAPQRIPFMAEGVAVWGADGHYKEEGLDERAAALRQLGVYQPLDSIVDNFYMATAHEIGYLEAASFVNYLIDTYGWQRFRAFYADTGGNGGQMPAAALNAALQTHYGMGTADVEAEWLAYLDGIDVEETAVADLQTSITFYETLRQYQKQYDPSAYFLEAWLPDPRAVRERGNSADLSRHPEDEINIVLELMLESASHALVNGDYDRADSVLNSVNRVIDSGGQFIDPLAINYRNVIRQLGQREYVPSHISINGDRAEITAVTDQSPTPTLIILRFQGSNWVFVN